MPGSALIRPKEASDSEAGIGQSASNLDYKFIHSNVQAQAAGGTN